MALDALELRNVAEVYRMLEGFVGLVAELAFAVGETAEIDWMFERSGARVVLRRTGRIVDYRMTDVAIISDYSAGIANVLAVVTAETA